MPVEYNVSSRPSRSTAGNRYAKLLQGELEKMKDDFYQDTYGGFNEEENDNDFDGDAMEDDDVLDSDFNTSDEQGDDEGGGANSDAEGEERKKKKTKRVLTRAYKEPKRVKEGETATAKRPKPKPEEAVGEVMASDMQLRRSTKDKRDAAEESGPSGGNKTGVRRKRTVQFMSQEERLREAEKMEVVNKESLEKFLKLEEEKKEKRHVKKIDKGPQITFKSTTCVSQNSQGFSNFSIASLTSPTSLQSHKRGDTKTCKNVIIFPDAKTLKENFSQPASSGSLGQSQHKKQLICPITRQPAKYFDPLTQQPYSSMSAFKVLRQIYKLKLSILHSTGNS